jgi:hypothetical protein
MAGVASVTLSTKGLQRADQISNKDFRFVNESDSFVCSRFQAAFISPRVATFLLSDPSIDEFSLTHTNSRSFQHLKSLICGESVNIDEENCSIFLDLVKDLGNAELSEMIINFVDKRDELDVSNCIFLLKLKDKLGVNIERERDFIASHISELHMQNIVKMKVCILSDILKSESNRIPSEDWLFEFVHGLGPQYRRLLGDVQFEYLSPSSIDHFFEDISHAEFDECIVRQLWNRSRHRIVYDTTKFLSRRYAAPVCVHRSPDSAWSGLISHLTELSGGNVHLRNIVTVSCSSTRKKEYWNVLDYDWDGYWESNDQPNSWIQFDFKDRFVSLTHYALKSDGDGGHHLLQWTVQGSVDGHSWINLDRRNTQELNGKY